MRLKIRCLDNWVSDFWVFFYWEICILWI